MSTAPPLSSSTPMPAAEHVLAHLDEILKSPAFSSSRRSQDFLRFVVLRTIDGQTDSIKERSIAIEVFGRPPHYEPSEDSIVRVKASEVRRRLTQFYDASAKDYPIRIELLPGTYVPRIRVAGQETREGTEKAAPEIACQSEPPPTRISRRRGFLLGAGALAGAAGIGVGAKYLWRDPVSKLWEPVIQSAEPLAIFLAILRERDRPDMISDRVGLGSAYGAVQVASFLARKGARFVVRMGSDLSFADLRRQPSFLFGAFSSTWPVELMQGKRFQLVRHSNHGNSVILDTKTGRSLTAVNFQPNGYAEEDYAVAARIFDAGNGQPIMFACGLTTFGGQIAAELMVDNTFFANALKDAPRDWPSKSFQILVRTRIIGHTPSAPSIVGTAFW